MTLTQDTELTPVVFRMFRAGRDTYKERDCIAVMYEDLGDYSEHTCASYIHIGQHGACDPRLVVRGSRLATPEEYRSLKDELEAAPYGYRLQVRKRIPRNARSVRMAKLAAIR